MSGNLARRIEGDQTGSAREMYSNVRRLRVLSRRRVSIDAVAIIKDQHLRIEIRNISQSGAGMRISGRAALDEPMTLHFADGRTVDAHVRWTRSHFCGVEFSKLLPFDDSLLGDLTATAATAAAAAVAAPGAAPDSAKAEPQAFHGASQSAPVGPHTLRAITRAASRAVVHLRGSVITAQIRIRLKNDTKMVERAVRKQGSAWLAEPD